MAYGLCHATFIIYRTTPARLAPSSTTGTLLIFFFLITRTLKQDDLAAAFSTTSLTELEQNYSSGLVVENNMSLFAENSEVFLFCLSILSADKTSKKDRQIFRKQRSGNIKVYAPKFPPITPVKAFPKFECNVYSDIDFQSAISVTSTGNSRSFTELTDRLAFVNFSSPVQDSCLFL